ncbi:MAG: hypothetical protein JWN70_6983 [Planctomycetaceae bacterium]|nr:hypothetical protein [Planctomycetaceae bacterium]
MLTPDNAFKPNPLHYAGRLNLGVRRRRRIARD